MKLLKILLAVSLITTVVYTTAPTQAQAFTLFGIRFFEKKPTPTPTIAPTPTPMAAPTPTVAASPVLGAQDNLPTTGPETSIAAILALIVAAFIARKYWQVSHKIN